LTPAEQEVLTRLTVFLGGFDRAAAEQVAEASLHTLLSLANKSWLQRVGQERYQIHELLCQYATQQMLPAERDALQERHALYFAGFLATLEQQMKSHRPDVAFDALAADLANVRAALAWLIAAGRFDVIIDQVLPPLFRYLESRYHFFLFAPLLVEGRQRAEALGLTRAQAILLMVYGAFAVFAHPMRFIEYPWVHPEFRKLMQQAWEPMPSDENQADFWSVLLAWLYGRYIDAEVGIERLRALLVTFGQTGRRWEEAFAWQGLGQLLQRRIKETPQDDRGSEANGALLRARELFDSLGDERESAITLLLMGLERWAAADRAAAKHLLLEAQERLRGLGEHIVASSINWHLAEIHLQLGELDASLTYFHEMADTLLESGRAVYAIGSLSRESYEAVRYGDLEYALHLRERSLALSRQTATPYNEAWDVWEMGELLRVMGQRQEARQWFERSRLLFNATGTEDGQSFYYRGLGDCGLAEGDYAEAERYFAESAAWAERTRHPWQHTYALTGLAKTALAGGRLATARDWFGRALRMAQEAGDAGGLVLVTILGIARWFRAMGDASRAEEVARLVLSHPLAWNETRGEAAALLGLPAEGLPARPNSIPFDANTLSLSLADELAGWKTRLTAPS
jgi:tetratricopeptide (TPR) repeat protein